MCKSIIVLEYKQKKEKMYIEAAQYYIFPPVGMAIFQSWKSADTYVVCGVIETAASSDLTYYKTKNNSQQQ